jgi:hypothetical protein
MPGSTTAPGRTGARNGAPVRIAFRQRYSVSAQNDVDFAAQWLAYAIPCRRFADILADAYARLGADVVWSCRIEARTGLRMMRRLLDPPYHSVRRVFPSTAGRLAFQTGPSQYAAEFKPAPGMRWQCAGLRPSFVHRVVSTVVPFRAGPVIRRCTTVEGG